MKLKLTSKNITTTRQSPVNATKLSKFADVACSIEKYQIIPLHNALVNDDVGDEHDGNKFIELSEYMKLICTEPLKFDDSRESLNVPGKSYVWLAPISEAKCGVNNTVSRNKLNFILKGNNNTFYVLKRMVNSVTDVSLLDSSCCPILTTNRKKRKK